MPIQKFKAADIPAPQNNRTSCWEQMSEWKEAREVVYNGLRTGEALEITLGPESMALTKNKNAAFYFMKRFKDKIPPKDYRYTAYLRGGKIYLVGKSEHK